MSQLADYFLGDRRIANNESSLTRLIVAASWLPHPIVLLKVRVLTKVLFGKIFKLDSIFFAPSSVCACGKIQAIKSL